MQKRLTAILILLVILGLFLRLWNINFGLPHSWYADEPEIGEPAIKYTYEIRSILTNNDISKLIPENYVYGTFPVYFYTLLLMLFSKSLNFLQFSFSKMDLYVYMRLINALISLTIIPVFILLVGRLKFVNSTLALISGAFLIAFNWKFIVHAHYLNHDIIITLLILLANYFFYRYLQHREISQNPESDTINTMIFAVFFGLAVSTKITVLLTLPIYSYFFLVNKDYRNMFGSFFIIMCVFTATNPFSLAFAGDFFRRLLEMSTKEAGMVYDSVDYNPFKYLSSLSWMLTTPILLLSAFGVYISKEETERHKRKFYLLLLVQVLVYLAFFSIQGRRVDRWMLPVIPNLILFAVIFLDYLATNLKNKTGRIAFAMFCMFAGSMYLYFPVVLLSNFQRNTPKSAAYIWAKQNLPENTTKFGITEEGLDPLNKLAYSQIWQFNVYESKGAYLVYPPNPSLFDYVFISSRPMSWTRKPVILSKYPYYAQRWEGFQRELADQNKFKLIKSFELSEPNLVPLSNVYIYKNLHEKQN